MSVKPPQMSSPLKRPRLSLQTKTAAPMKLNIGPMSPTSFNTFTNACAFFIGNSSPRPASTCPPKQPKNLSQGFELCSDRSTIQCRAPTTAYPGNEDNFSVNTMVSMPSHSVKPDNSFSTNTSDYTTPSTPSTARERPLCQEVPYTHPRSLRSILRNSPLVPLVSSTTTATSNRLSVRMPERRPKKVSYNDPLTQTILTHIYIKSHIDLLTDYLSYPAAEPKTGINAKGTTVLLPEDESGMDVSTSESSEENRKNTMEVTWDDSATQKRKRSQSLRNYEWTINIPEVKMVEEMPLRRTSISRL
ncbi:unnamed protein product [Blumeria hordei]|uniref:Uncharacterized protein n=2 Tax=Blumeria hordei TaxID=2867405 RepID=A0A383UQH2_BLUHO|nr:hypothetical protein BGHDH14_bgh02273 [Blumeria hordei DH14]SZF02583.1 unnamed protein product [Blumeria hordei]